jgi:UDP-2-acetamido-2-deoxy-ribo-hexuluronate aminotransferase
MDTLQCAIVLAKLSRFDWEVEQRTRIGNIYNQLIDEIGIRRVQQKGDRTSVFGQYTIFVEDRSTVQAKLSEQGVPTAVHYPVPLNRQPAYAHLCCPDCTPNADIAAAQVMSLPMSPYLSEGDQQKVIASIKIAIGA